MNFLINPTIMRFAFVIPYMEASGGVQKVKGFSRGWHHWNSVRLGIHRENDNYILFNYAYFKGVPIEVSVIE